MITLSIFRHEDRKITLFTNIFLNNIPAYPTRAPNTNSIHDNTQTVSALNPSTFGEVAGMLLKILVNTKNRVTNKVILPGTMFGSTRKLTYIWKIRC